MCGLKRPHKTSGEPCWATTKTNVVCFVYYSNIFLVRCNLASDPRNDHVSNHRCFFFKLRICIQILLYSVCHAIMLLCQQQLFQIKITPQATHGQNKLIIHRYICLASERYTGVIFFLLMAKNYILLSINVPSYYARQKN